MVRKTKEDAAITRQRIIDAAREMFLLKGVSRTSLEQIATHASVTRGAVYWHFQNKAELFHAMREEVYLPLIDRMDDTLLGNADESNIDPLGRIRKHLESTVQILDDDQTTRATYEVMMTKCEYVDEFADVLQSILSNCSGLVHKLEQAYTKAQEIGQVGNQPAVRRPTLGGPRKQVCLKQVRRVLLACASHSQHEAGAITRYSR